MYDFDNPSESKYGVPMSVILALNLVISGLLNMSMYHTPFLLSLLTIGLVKAKINEHKSDQTRLTCELKPMVRVYNISCKLFT